MRIGTGSDEARVAFEEGEVGRGVPECVDRAAALVEEFSTVEDVPVVVDLRASGGQLVCNNEVTTLTETNRDVHLTLASGDEWRGDQLILATGRWAPTTR